MPVQRAHRPKTGGPRNSWNELLDLNFGGQGYRMLYTGEKLNLTEFTKFMDRLFEEICKATGVKIQIR